MSGFYTYNTSAYWDNKAMDASLQWQCQDHLLLVESKGDLETIFDAYSGVPAHQRHVPLVRWFSEFCLGIARALNGAHDKIINRLDQDPPGDSQSQRVLRGSRRSLYRRYLVLQHDQIKRTTLLGTLQRIQIRPEPF